MTAGTRSVVLRRPRLASGAAVLGAAFGLAVGLSSAEAQAPHYQDKEIEIVVPFAEGGAVDVTVRFLAPYLQKHIPGNPLVRVRHRPGGGSILGANWFEQNADPDGTIWLVTTASTTHPFLFQMQEVEYDLLNKRIGFAMPWGGIFYSAPEAGVRDVSDLTNPEAPLVLGGITAQGSDLPAILAFEALHIDFRTVLGFTGGGPVRLAFERGELNLDFQATPVYITQVVPMVEEGRAIPLFTGGYPGEDGEMTERDLVMTELPSVYEAHQTLYGEPPSGVEWDAFQRIASLAWEFGITAFLHEDTPEEALAALAQAAESINADPEFQAAAKDVTGGYPLVVGSEVEPKMRAALEPGGEVYDHLKDLLATKYGVRF